LIVHHSVMQELLPCPLLLHRPSSGLLADYLEQNNFVDIDSSVLLELTRKKGVEKKGKTKKLWPRFFFFFCCKQLYTLLFSLHITCYYFNDSYPYYIILYILKSFFEGVFFSSIYIPSRFSFFLLLLPGTTTFIQIDVFFGPGNANFFVSPQYYFRFDPTTLIFF
jgi:hypothetical protein